MHKLTGYRQIIFALSGGLLLCGFNFFDNALDWRNAEVRNGKIYSRGENKTFSGKVTNIPSQNIFRDKTGYKQLSGHTGVEQINSYDMDSLCDTEVNEGIIDGNIVCTTQSGAPHIKTTFSKGAINGSFTMYSYSRGVLIAEASFKNDLLDGVIKKYDEKSEKMISRQSVKNGKPDGRYERWDPETGILVAEANWKDGQLVSKKEMDRQGKLASEVNYKNEQLDGYYKNSDINTHVIIEANYKNGKLDGLAKNYSLETGKLLSEINYKNGTFDGSAKLFDAETGKTIVDGNYRDGFPDGGIVSINPKTDEVIKKGVFSDNKFTGTVVGYTEFPGLTEIDLKRLGKIILIYDELFTYKYTDGIMENEREYLEVKAAVDKIRKCLDLVHSYQNDPPEKRLPAIAQCKHESGGASSVQGTSNDSGGTAKPTDATSGSAEAKPQAPTRESLCSGTEEVIFSCSTGEKMVSVCQTNASGAVQYRFGKPGSAIDIALPENPASREGVVKGTTSFSVGGGSYIAFTKGDTRYVVHDYVGQRGEDTGIDVEGRGKKPITIQCVGLPIGNLENNIPASIPVDPQSMRQ